MKRLKGKLTISRVSTNESDDVVRVRIMDELSSCEAVEVQIDLAGFALALTGMGYVPCDYEFNDSGYVGKRREHKRVKVAVAYDASAAKVREAVAAHEVDGWQGRDGDCKNGHNRAGFAGGEEKYWVVFERWVDAEVKQ